MKIDNGTGVQDLASKTLEKREQVEQKYKEVFKDVFLKKMFSQMIESIQTQSEIGKVQNELITDQMSEILADKYIESTDIRWEQFFGAQANPIKTTNEK